MIAARIQSIAIFGDGVVGLSAALAFRRALPSVKLTIVSTGADLAALADRLPGNLPGVRHFHRLVGIAEQELVAAGAASHRLGTRFEHWREDGQPWYHCFGEPLPQINSSPFSRQWLRLQAEGQVQAYDIYSPGAALARAEKFAQPIDEQQSLLRNVDYALRLDPGRYRATILELIQFAKVELLRAQVSGVVTGEPNRVSHVVLDDGQTITADLFVDCAGPSAPIISKVDTSFVSWAEFLPCDRIVVDEAAASASPVDRAIATDSGYVAQLPLPTGSCSLTIEATAFSGSGAPRAVDYVTIKPGTRKTSWVGNVVAFGDAAVALDPLESTNLYLAHSAIRRAVTLLPDTDFHPLILEEFNRRTFAECERVRDFVAAHYIASSRRSGPFWKSIPDWKVSDSLAHTLEQFRARGRLPKFEEETFDDESWLSVFLGLGLYPERLDPAGLRVSEADGLAMMKRVAEASAALPARLPPYPEYLERLRAASPR